MSWNILLSLLFPAWRVCWIILPFYISPLIVHRCSLERCSISYHHLLWKVDRNTLPGFYLRGLLELLLNRGLFSFPFFELESITKKVAKPVLCIPGSVRDLSVWKLPLPVGAWKESKSWTLNFMLVSSRGTLLGTGGCWLKSLYFKVSIKHSFKPVLKDAFSQCISLFLWLRHWDTRKLSTFYVASILLNMNRSIVDNAGVL